MAQQTIDLGTLGGVDGTGDSIRAAGDKINDNFTELYALPVVASDISFQGNTIVSKSSNADIVISASGTGAITLGGYKLDDNNIQTVDTNGDLKINANGSGYVVIDGLGFAGTSIHATDSTIINLNENLIVAGTLATTGNVTVTGTVTGVTGSTIGNITLANGSITDSSGTISFGNENVTTTGTLSAETGDVIGNMTFADGSITDSSGAITFDNENLSTSGNINAGTTTFSSLAVSASSSFVGTTTIDNLTLNDNIISTSSNADLNLTPGGTGVVNVSNMTIDSSVNLTDNVIKVTRTNDDFILSANGTGSVQVSNIDMNSGTVDNVVIGGGAAGTFTTLAFNPASGGTLSSTGVKITHNEIKAIESNANLEFAANASGYVEVNGFQLPNADGEAGQLLRTDGSKEITWVTSPILLGQSEIQDARNTIGFSTLTTLNSVEAVGSHESITNLTSVVDEFDQTQFDSAWYLLLQRYDSADSSIEYAASKTIVAQGTEDGSTFDAFNGTSQIVKSFDTDEIIQTSTDIRSSVSKVRLLGTSGTLADGSTKSTNNALSFYRIGLGDNDSSGWTDGKASTKVVADLDSAEATLDSWSASSFRGAKYYVSINNTTTNEVQNVEVLLVHNGSDAFVSQYNSMTTNTSSTPLATFAADINSGNVRLRGANGTAGTCRVNMYRILLADNESDSSGTYENVIGAQQVSNTASATIDANSFRGSASPDMSSQKVINSWAKTSFDSVFYHMVQKDMTNDEFVMNKLSVNHGVGSDGSTEDAFVSDSHVVKSGEMNDISAFDANINGSTVELKATGQSDGSTAIQNSLQYYAIGLGPDTTTGTSGNIGTHAGIIAGGNNETTIDHVTAFGSTQGIVAAERSVAEFTAGQFDSAWYFVVSNDTVNTSIQTQKVSLMHNMVDAFVTSSAVAGTDVGDTHPTYDGDVVASNDSTSKVRLRSTDSDGSSVTPNNTMAYYRIGLGDDDSTGYVGAETDETTVARATLTGSSVANIDTFAKGANSGAKYFISINDQSTGEMSNIEALVTHDNTNAFITTFNEHFSGTSSLITLTADISGSDVRLRGVCRNNDGIRVTAYKILLADTESAQTGTNTRTIANVTVSSSATAIDTFDHNDVDAAHYIIVGTNGADEKFITEATVVTDGAGAFVSQQGDVSTKGTVMLELAAAHDGSSTVTLSASSTSGASTSVMAYRIQLKAPIHNIVTVDSWSTSSYRGAKYYISADDTINGHITNIECLVIHDGTSSYISTFGQHNSNVSLLSLTTDVSGGNVRLLAEPTAADVRIKFYRIRLADNESGSTGTDFNTVAATTVSSSATAIDTFVDTQFTGAHYVIVARNNTEGSSEIQEATVVTNGTTAFVSHANHVSSKSTAMLTLSAAHDGSSTVTLNAASTAGGSTTVNAFRIHMKVEDAFAYDVLDSFAQSSYQLANYIIVGKNASNQSQIAEVMVTSDGTDAYKVDDGSNISTHSETEMVMKFTAVMNSGNVELRAENNQQNTDTTVNMYKVQLARAEGNPQSVATLDSFAKADFRGAKYTISVSDASSGDLGLYETLDLSVTHDGTNVFISTFGRVTNHTTDLVEFSADISGDNVRIRGSISSTNTHTVTLMRRLMKV